MARRSVSQINKGRTCLLCGGARYFGQTQPDGSHQGGLLLVDAELWAGATFWQNSRIRYNENTGLWRTASYFAQTRYQITLKLPEIAVLGRLCTLPNQASQKAGEATPDFETP